MRLRMYVWHVLELGIERTQNSKTYDMPLDGAHKEKPTSNQT